MGVYQVTLFCPVCAEQVQLYFHAFISDINYVHCTVLFWDFYSVLSTSILLFFNTNFPLPVFESTVQFNLFMPSVESIEERSLLVKLRVLSKEFTNCRT